MRGVCLAGKLLSIFLTLAAAPFVISPTNASACASTTISLAPVDDEVGWASPSNPFFAAPEGADIDFAIERRGHECDSTKTATATWKTMQIEGPGAATSQVDYSAEDGEEVQFGIPSHTEPVRSSGTVLTLPPDADASPIEEFRITLASVTGAGKGLTEVPAYILDADGQLAFNFAPASWSQSESMARARVAVFMTGEAPSGGAVEYRLRDGSAEAGSDFTGSLTGTLSLTSSSRVGTIPFSIVNDAANEPNETLEIVLVDGDVEIASTTFTIVDNEEGMAPVSRWHHPRNGVAYAFGDYRLREVHVFTSDEGGAGVRKAQIALRRKLANGKCQWWSGNGFTGGGCSEKRWIRTKSYNENFYFYRFLALKPSEGTRVRKYTAYSRAIDAAGNVEQRFTAGRNANSFEVRRR